MPSAWRAAADVEHVTCTASIACARDYATCSGGVTGLTCTMMCVRLHTVPGKDLFIAVWTGEQSCFFYLIIAELMPDAPTK